jgi:hypothetical protein
VGCGSWGITRCQFCVAGCCCCVDHEWRRCRLFGQQVRLDTFPWPKASNCHHNFTSGLFSPSLLITLTLTDCTPAKQHLGGELFFPSFLGRGRGSGIPYHTTPHHTTPDAEPYMYSIHIMAKGFALFISFRLSKAIIFGFISFLSPSLPPDIAAVDDVKRGVVTMK